MGWWPSSSSKAEPQQPTSTSTPERSAPPPSPSQNDDFNEAFPHLAPPPNSANPSSSSPSSQTPSAPTSSSQAEDFDPTLPTTMSCRAAFDAAFYCSSFGGHFNDIYRYGQLRSCSEHWADWRFCMSLSSSSAEAKARAIQARYKEKEEKVRQKPSSEDVWQRRGPGEMIERPFGRAEEEARRVEGS